MKKKSNKKYLSMLSKYKQVNIEQLEHINQYVITIDNVKMFKSYDSLIAIYNYADDVLVLGADFDYSNTTMRHLYMFIDMYCSYRISSIIHNASNKKQALWKAIYNDEILYDVSMR